MNATKNTNATNEAATKNTNKPANEGKEGKTMNKPATKPAAPKTAPKTATKPANKPNEGKEGKTMNKPENAATNEAAAKNAPPAMTAAEKIIDEARRTPLSEKIAAALDKAKNAAGKNARAEAAEEAAALIREFNEKSFTNAARRASFIAAAESVRANEPKKAESRAKGVDYLRRADVVFYPYMDESGKLSSRVLTLPAFARFAFAENMVTEEQYRAFAAALVAIEFYQKNNVENETHEGGKEAAAALTALAKACGLDCITTKTAENGHVSPFFVHRSFIYAAAARMKGKRGVYETEAAALNEARAALLLSNDKNHARAAERAARAEARAVKMIFNIINEAAAAAVYGVWNASVLTAAEAEAARKAREEAEAAKAKAREAAKAEAAKEKARKEAERAALKKERDEKKAAERKAREEAAANKAKTAKKPAAKKPAANATKKPAKNAKKNAAA